MHACLAKTRAALLGALCVLGATAAGAQELTPRAYWPAPKGTRVAIFGYAHGSGDVLSDPSLPLYGVDSSLDTSAVGFLQTFSLWGRTSNVVVELPYSWGTTKGVLEDTPARRDFSGFGDLRATLSVNLLGAPSMDLQQFRELRADPHPILGASIKILAPTGSYDQDRLINVGAHRWAIRPELGYTIPLSRGWMFELDLGTWLFGDDDEFVGGEREQDPILAAQAHLVRRFKPGFWAALDLNYYTGGRQTIGGERLGDVQRNSRAGVTVVVPVARRHAVKLGYSLGVVTSFGTDYRQLSLSYQALLN